MTRKRAAELLRDLAAGDESEFGKALAVAVKALEPAERKVKAKVSPSVAAFLKMRFPTHVGGNEIGSYRQAMGRDGALIHENAQLVAQFRYGARNDGQWAPYEARVPGAQADKATLAAVLAGLVVPVKRPARWVGLTPPWALTPLRIREDAGVSAVTSP